MGNDLYEQVFYSLDLIEKDYFGLQFMDANHVKHWLDPTKAIKKQVKSKLCATSVAVAWHIFIYFLFFSLSLSLSFVCSRASVHIAIESEVLLIRTEYIARRIDTLSVFPAIETRLIGRSSRVSRSKGRRIVRTGTSM